jgi:hypothetical protein
MQGFSGGNVCFVYVIIWLFISQNVYASFGVGNDVSAVYNTCCTVCVCMCWRLISLISTLHMYRREKMNNGMYVYYMFVGVRF